MARPLKDGIDYFPFDVGFLEDKKIRLIKGEFGLKGVLVVIQLLCSIYKENGYFSTCDNDDCILVADAVGCGCDAKTIREVVQGCLRRSVFDNRVFETFGVLTSRGIQRRYLRALSTRENIDIYKEYWLLDINNKKDVPASISKKITFKNVSLQNYDVYLQRNEDSLQKNPIKKSKEKESKVEESKNAGDISKVFQTFDYCGFQINGYTRDELLELVDVYTDEWVLEAIKRAADRGKRTMGYIKGILNNWQIAGAMDSSKCQQSDDGWEDF
ncbi:DUF4373 domain-containing protein [Clostridiales Family XIII bacterium ASD5510]|uniref:DUF4373 domain-containing protein n=1 Tax=Hominibacterium faecale TaxID=2839743 RepID=A0A9J6QY95_9FIRM|nr:Lin1244/Lin1753 domain-containing protein [Hominibacterium faecale]MCU7380478.1 DUF4373 domain-containing protein [Hominibacterium faecale]